MPLEMAEAGERLGKMPDGFAPGTLSIAGVVVNHFEDLAFDDAADAVEVGAALAFDVVFAFWLATEPEDDADDDQHCNSGERKPFVPIAERVLSTVALLHADRLAGTTAGGILFFCVDPPPKIIRHGIPGAGLARRAPDTGSR